MTRTLVAGRLVILVLFAVAAVFAVLALAGCSRGPSEAGCKKALETAYTYALAHPDAKPATEPAACKGLSKAVLTKLAGQVANEAFNGTLPKS